MTTRDARTPKTLPSQLEYGRSPEINERPLGHDARECIARGQELLQEAVLRDADEILLAMTPRTTCNGIQFIRISEREINTVERTRAIGEREVWDQTHTVRIKWRVLNGPNTTFEIVSPNDYVVVGLKRFARIERTNRAPLVYTAYSRTLDTGPVASRGYQYLRSVIAEAQGRLWERQVRSRAFPNELAASIPWQSTALELAVIEHIDPGRLAHSSIDRLVGEVLFVVGANRTLSYASAHSKAGAFGLFQFIPSTYARVRAQYPEAGLIADFEEGMRNHLNAATATLLLFDSDLAHAPSMYRSMLRFNSDALGEYLAAMYNSGRAWRTITRFGREWKSHLPEETQSYLVKFAELRRVLQDSAQCSLP